MKLNFTVDDLNQKIDLSFIPFSFMLLEDLLGSYKVQSVDRLSFGIFEDNQEDVYITIDNYKEYLGEIVTIKDVLNFFTKYTDRETYTVYKLGLNFEGFSMLYDDDSLITLRPGNIRQYNLIHQFYLRLFDLYQKENYKLDK